MQKSNGQASYGPTNPTPETQAKSGVRRFGSVIGLNPETEKYYRDLHANIRNYSIYTTEIDSKKYLFSYFEYVGEDFDADMKTMASDPEMQRWWKETDPCQIQLPARKPDANWSEMEMVFLAE